MPCWSYWLDFHCGKCVPTNSTMGYWHRLRVNGHVSIMLYICNLLSKDFQLGIPKMGRLQHNEICDTVVNSIVVALCSDCGNWCDISYRSTCLSNTP